jgi:LysM repeat protein
MRLLSDEILHMDQTSTDYQNKRFEIRALGRVAVTRGRDAIDSGHTYTVRSGDTLWGIAQTHLGGGARWTRIMALNVVELQDPNAIGVGATLKMPQPFAGVVPPTVVTPPTRTVGRGQKRTREDDDSESNKNQKTGSPESP